VKGRRNLRLSIRALAASKLRTLLSAAGVAVGISSVVVLLGAGAGAERAVQESLEQLGHNLLVINPSRIESSALRGEGAEGTNLRVEDWRALSRDVPGVLRTAPVVERPLLAQWGGEAVSVRVLGTTEAFARARNFSVAAGRFLDSHDEARRSRVAVVGPVVVESLFRGESPIGEVVTINGVPFRIIGVTRKKGVYDGGNEDELVLIPVTTAMRRLVNVDYLTRIYVQTVSEEVSNRVQASIAAALRERHAIPANRPDDFHILDQEATIRARRQAGGSLSRYVPWLSALALVLGGVGLLAVSLLSVRERYAEIGIRLAVGARPRDVLAQFLIEALLVSSLGGFVGIFVGSCGILIGTALTRWPMELSGDAVFYPLALSVGLAIAFGVVPAFRAARLDPIEALKSH
jgi:putative ABC transport system permease protein